MRPKTGGQVALVLQLLAVVMMSGCISPTQTEQAAIIEVVTFQLKSGIMPDEFRKLDRAVEVVHVAKQPGFIARESAASEDRRWLAIVH